MCSTPKYRLLRRAHRIHQCPTRNDAVCEIAVAKALTIVSPKSQSSLPKTHYPRQTQD